MKFKRLFFFILLFLILFSLPKNLFAQSSLRLSLPGWTHQEGSKEKAGIVLESATDVQFSSVVVDNLDGDLSNGLETVVGSSNGIVFAYHSDGTLLWKVELPNFNCSDAGSNNKLISSPAVGDLLGDGTKYVVIGYGGITTACGGGVVAIKGDDGSLFWHFNLIRFGKRFGFSERLHSVVSIPALADTNQSGTLEIGFGAFDRNVYLLDARGKAIWYYNAADTVWSSPAFADIGKPRGLEMIIGTDISQNKALKPPTSNGGILYAFKGATKYRRFGKKARKRSKTKHLFFRQRKAFKWKRALNQVIFSSPVVADLFEQIPGKEIVVGSGCFFPQGSSNKRGKWIKIFRQRKGKLLKTISIPGCLESEIALGDIDEDGKLEIVLVSNEDPSVGGDGIATLVAYKRDGTLLWQRDIQDVNGANNSFGSRYQSPVVADVDGNGSLEVIVANGSSVNIYSGKDGSPLTCQGKCKNGLTAKLKTGGSLKSTPAVADVNQDGKLDIIIGGVLSDGRGALYGWTGFDEAINSEPGTKTPYLAPWPMKRGNAKRTGVFNPTNL